MSSGKESAADDVNVVRSVGAAIALEDVDAVLAVLDPQVRWHGAGDGEQEEGCRKTATRCSPSFSGLTPTA